MKFLQKVNFCLQPNLPNGPFYGKQWSWRMGEHALVDVIAKQFWKKILRSGPAHEEQSCPCLLGLTTCDLIDCFPLKTGDLIYSQQFSFLTIAWPPHSQASLYNQKGREELPCTRCTSALWAIQSVPRPHGDAF